MVHYMHLLHYTLYNSQCTLYNGHCMCLVLYIKNCILTVWYAVHIYCKLYSVHTTVHIVSVSYTHLDAADE